MGGAFDAGTVSGRLVLDIKDWSANIEKAEKSSNSLSDVVQKNKEEIERLGKAFAVVGAAISAALGVALKKTADYGDELWKTSQRTGIATEMLSGLKLAADKSDLSLQLLANGLAKMSRTFVEANDGMKEYQEVVKKLGISIVDSSGKMKSMDVLLDDIADKFADMPSGVEKTALAMDVFGKSGAQMIPLLNLGSEGLRKEREEAERLGLIMGGPAAKAGEAFNDAITTLKKSFMGLSLTVGKALIPPVKFLVDTFTSAVAILRKGLEVFPPLGSAITKLGGVVGVLATAFGGVLMVLPRVLSMKTKIAAIIPVLSARLKALNLSLGFVGIALTAVVVAVEATQWAFKKLEESQKKAMGEIYDSAEKSSKGWKFAQASIRGETEVTKQKMQELLKHWREMGKTSEEIGDHLYDVFKNKIAKAAKSSAKDVADVAQKVAEVQATLTDKIKALTLNEFEYRIWQTAKWRDDLIAKTKDSVDAAKIAAEAQKVYAMEVANIRKEQAKEAAEAEEAALEKLRKVNAKVMEKILDKIEKVRPEISKNIQDISALALKSTISVGKKFNITFDELVTKGKTTGTKVKKTFSDIATSINQTIQVLQQGFGQFFQNLNQLSEQRYKNEMDRMQSEYEEKRKQIEESLMSEEEKKTALEALDAEYADKKRELEIKQAEANKRSSLMQAIVNTALAVTSALSTKPFIPMGLIAAAAALAAGYVQVRVIQAQTVPAMAEGGLVRRPTHVLAGEAGPEAILPMRELRRMLGTDRKSVAGTRNINVNINAIDTKGMESYTRQTIIPEIKRALARESFTISPNAVR